jgi:hypothetical protein
MARDMPTRILILSQEFDKAGAFLPGRRDIRAIWHASRTFHSTVDFVKEELRCACANRKPIADIFGGTAMRDWRDLTRMTQGRRMVIERVRIEGDLAVEGAFDLPPLAHLTAEDQLFVAAFVRAHGSIKAMEGLYDVSYPTIKNRLNRIGAQLAHLAITPGGATADALAKLDKGEATVGEVIGQSKG